MCFSPQWHALGNEAELAGAQIAIGVTALGRASHERHGDYTTAFFGLANGLERLGKLIVVADYAITHQGKFPDDKFLKDNFRHNLALLLDHCEAVSAARTFNNDYSKRPNDRVHQGIIQTLNEFGRLSRYHNLDSLVGGQAAALEEPVGAWWKRVGEPILALHYTAHQRDKDTAMALSMDKLMSSNTLARHFSETRESINDVATLSRRAGATHVVQKYGRLYVLQIVRWLSCMFVELAYEATAQGMEAFAGAEEPFRVFAFNDDDYFRTRKTWTIYF